MNEKRASKDLPRPEPSQTRRHSMFRTLLVVAATAMTLSALVSHFLPTTRLLDSCISLATFKGPPSLEEIAYRVLKENPLIDGHNDLLILLREKYSNHIYGQKFTDPWEQGGLEGQVDLPRMHDGLYSGAFWSAWYPCQKDIFDFSAESYDPIVRATLSQLDLFHRLSARYPATFAATPDARTAIKNFAAGKMISPVAIEGLHQIGDSFANLRLYHQLGVRYATLNWNCHNPFSDAAVLTFMNNGSSVASSPFWGGVSLKGRSLVREMNRLGMLVDLSHVSKDTMIDILNGTHAHGPKSDVPPEETQWSGSIAPPIFSHSSAYALCPHPRNVPDDILQLVKARNSLVMVNVNPDFISCTAPPEGSAPDTLPALDEAHNTIEQVVKHILHIGNLIGFDHVGIGTDFDGISGTPRGLEDAGAMPELVKQLLEAGVSGVDAGKIAGRNLLRVWQAVDEVAAKMAKKGVLPVEDEVVGWPGVEGTAYGEEIAAGRA